MHKLAGNFALIVFLLFVTGGLIYSVYDGLIREEPVDTVHEAVLNACERGRQRSLLDQQFALEAAKARRRNAETAAEMGKDVVAGNELATAKIYEDIAEGYRRLTIPCEVAYPQP